MKTESANETEARRLVESYADLVLRLSYTYLKSTYDAEDICQTVFLKLMRSSPRFDSREHEKAWIVRATANACKDVLRSGFRRRTVGLEAMPELVVPDEADGEVMEAVLALSRNYREAIYLHYYEGYSIREIAEITGRSESAVSAHLSRGRGKLRTMLKGAYSEQGV